MEREDVDEDTNYNFMDFFQFSVYSFCLLLPQQSEFDFHMHNWHQHIPLQYEKVRAVLKVHQDICVPMYLGYAERNKAKIMDLLHQETEAEKVFAQHGIQSSSKYTTSVFSKLRLQYCMVDNLEHCIVIGPDGAFYPCEHMNPEQSWGNIFDGVIDKEKYQALCQPYETAEKCRKCAFLPFCTSFFRHECPLWNENCVQFKTFLAKKWMNSIEDDSAMEL